MGPMRKYATGLAAGVLVLVLGGCGGDGGNAAPLAQATIGPAGGTVASADGRVALVVPAGALGASTAIVITEVSGDKVPANIRPAAADVVYRLEPAGTRFDVPARLTVRVPPSVADEIALMLHESAGSFEFPANLTTTNSSTERVVEADVSHFSYMLVKNAPEVRIKATPSVASVPVGGEFTVAVEVTNRSGHSLLARGAYFKMNSKLLWVDDPSPLEPGQTTIASEGGTRTSTGLARCTDVGRGVVTGYYHFEEPFFTAFGMLGNFQPSTIVVYATTSADCIPATSGQFVVATGLFALSGLSAPDGVNYFGGPFANLGGTGFYASFAGAEGVKVLDLVTRQVVLDRTAAGTDGATLGTSLLGAVPVSQAVSAGATAAMVGYASDGAFVQNWSAASWGGTGRDFEPTFDVVTAGGGLVANTVALVRPVFGIDFVTFDATAMAYRTDPARFAPLSTFPGGGQLVSAQMPDAASGGMLALSRATSASISTSSKVFFKNVDDAQPATTLLSWGNVDTRRLRCLPVGTKQACVATLFGGEGRAFLFDPASPRDTPRVIVLTAAAGTLGVAQAMLPNGHVGVVMANFTANSLTVAELSTDLVTIHSSSTIPAPAGCTGTAHPALVSDSEGLKAIVTCNGTSNYWVVKPFS
jgi:hypothetical protein